MFAQTALITFALLVVVPVQNQRAIAALSLFVGGLPSSPSAERTARVVIENVDSGQPLPNTSVGVQLFPPEHGARKVLSQACVPMTGAQPVFALTVATDEDGSFTFKAPGGDYLAKIAIRGRQPIYGCIYIDPEGSERPCNSRPVMQTFFVRTTSSIPGFYGDILGSSACAPYQPSLCDPLRVANLVVAKKIILLDDKGTAVGNANLEFRQNSKALGKFVGRVVTDAAGVAEVSSFIKSGGLLRMTVKSDRMFGDFLIQFASGGADGEQPIQLFHWRCRGSVMQGILVSPDGSRAE